MIDKIRASKHYPTLIQFIKFGVIGVSNTAVSYAVDMFGMYVLFKNADMSETAKVVLVSAMAFLISTVHSYYWNNRFVFRSETQPGGKEHLARYFRMAQCYALTGLVLAPLMKLGLSALGIPYWAASLLTLAVTVPLNFILNKLWAFKDGRPKT